MVDWTVIFAATGSTAAAGVAAVTIFRGFRDPARASPTPAAQAVTAPIAVPVPRSADSVPPPLTMGEFAAIVERVAAVERGQAATREAVEAVEAGQKDLRDDLRGFANEQRDHWRDQQKSAAHDSDEYDAVKDDALRQILAELRRLKGDK